MVLVKWPRSAHCIAFAVSVFQYLCMHGASGRDLNRGCCVQSSIFHVLACYGSCLYVIAGLNLMMLAWDSVPRLHALAASTFLMLYTCASSLL